MGAACVLVPILHFDGGRNSTAFVILNRVSRLSSGVQRVSHFDLKTSPRDTTAAIRDTRTQQADTHLPPPPSGAVIGLSLRNKRGPSIRATRRALCSVPLSWSSLVSGFLLAQFPICFTFTRPSPISRDDSLQPLRSRRGKLGAFHNCRSHFSVPESVSLGEGRTITSHEPDWFFTFSLLCLLALNRGPGGFSVNYCKPNHRHRSMQVSVAW